MKSDCKRLILAFLFSCAAIIAANLMAGKALAGSLSLTLAPAENFAGIANAKAHSLALFAEIGKVLTSPRCMNCHAANDRPRQGDSGRLHQPPVFRGPDGLGLPAMRCPICHLATNFDPARMPGNKPWLMAPSEMTWEGKTISQICVQMRDPKLNGGKSLADLVHHIGDDKLVGWGWNPGIGRTPAPGTQEQAKALVQTWVDTGAECP
jgi:hypothetical protein